MNLEQRPQGGIKVSEGNFPRHPRFEVTFIEEGFPAPSRRIVIKDNETFIESKQEDGTTVSLPVHNHFVVCVAKRQHKCIVSEEVIERQTKCLRSITRQRIRTGKAVRKDSSDYIKLSVLPHPVMCLAKLAGTDTLNPDSK